MVQKAESVKNKALPKEKQKFFPPMGPKVSLRLLRQDPLRFREN
jgi:hypothetical protein